MIIEEYHLKLLYQWINLSKLLAQLQLIIHLRKFVNLLFNYLKIKLLRKMMKRKMMKIKKMQMLIFLNLYVEIWFLLYLMSYKEPSFHTWMKYSLTWVNSLKKEKMWMKMFKWQVALLNVLKMFLHSLTAELNSFSKA